MHRRRLGGVHKTLTLIVAGLLVGACSPSVDIGESLVGRTFVSTGAADGPFEHPLVRQITIDFYRPTEGGQPLRIWVDAGCNGLGADARIERGRLVTGEIESTAVGCPPEFITDEDWMRTLISTSPTVRLDVDQLTIEGWGQRLELVDLSTRSPVDLFGAWRLVATIADATATPVTREVTSEIEFLRDGQLRVRPGCNSGGGTFEFFEDQLRFVDLALTEMGCSGPAGDVEATVLAVIGAGPMTFRIDGASLTLTSGELGLQYARVTE